MLENARMAPGTVSVSFHVALRSGSSKHGNTRRAYCGSSCVTAYTASGLLLPEQRDGPVALDEPAVGERQPHFARRQDLRELEAHHVVAARHLRGRDRLVGRGEDRRARVAQRDALCIEPDEVGRLEHADRDVERAAEDFAGGIDAQVRVVRERRDVARQPQARHRGRGGLRDRRRREGEHGKRRERTRSQNAAEDNGDHA